MKRVLLKEVRVVKRFMWFFSLCLYTRKTYRWVPDPCGGLAPVYCSRVSPVATLVPAMLTMVQ